MLEHEQNMAALNNHLQMTRLRQQKRFVSSISVVRRRGGIISFCVPMGGDILRITRKGIVTGRIEPYIYAFF